MNLSYKESFKEVSETILNTATMILATSDNDRVSARNMSFVFDGIWLYFQTDIHFLKTEQIRSNPMVAIAFSNFQITGLAEETGHPFLEKNRIFRELFQEKHQGSFEKYSSLPDETVFRIKPVMITIWKYIEGEPYRDFISIETEKAWRVRYGE